jgi:uncharacterized membrane protein
MQKRFFVAMTLALAISACEAESTSTTTTTTSDTAGGADTSGGADTTSGDTAAADTASTDTTATDTTAADTAASDTAATDTATASGGFDKAGPALATKCATCHASIAKAKFDGKDCSVAAGFAAKIKGAIDMGGMPPKGSPALTADEKAAILDWAAAGASCK